MKIVREVKAQARHPIQISVLVWWIFAGVSSVINGPSPGSLVAPTTVILLGVTLVASAAVCLVGSLIADIVGLPLELWGWAGIVLTFVVYGYVIISVETTAITVGSLYLFVPFIIGGGWRTFQIRRAIRRLKQIRHHEIESL